MRFDTSIVVSGGSMVALLRQIVEADDRHVFRNADAELVQGLDDAVGDDVVGAEIALGEVDAGGEQAGHIRICAIIGGFERDHVVRIHRQSKPRRVPEERLLPQPEIGGVDMTCDKADAAETLIAQSHQNLVDGVLIVHVDEIGLDDIVDRIDEDRRQADTLDHPDIGFGQLGAERNDTADRRGGQGVRRSR